MLIVRLYLSLMNQLTETVDKPLRSIVFQDRQLQFSEAR